MEKYVYKLINNINGKIYIGQTNNLKRRMQEHKHDKRRNHPIHMAIKEYGWENFSLEVLYYGDDYNRMEEYYIALFKTNDQEYGYNIHVGGNNQKGENNSDAKLTQIQVNEIIDYLLNSDLSYDEIAAKYNVNKKYIVNINKGAAWKKDELSYPLKRYVKRLPNESLCKIVELLKSGYSISDIESITGEERYTILDINKGFHWRIEGITYPIQDLHNTEVVDKVIDLLKNSNLSIKEISEVVGIKKSTIYRINSGLSYPRHEDLYPIRKLSTERNELGQFKSGFLL